MPLPQLLGYSSCDIANQYRVGDIHNILAGSWREQRIVLNTLRFLSNRLQISLVCFGVNDAREAISGDVQLARRFEQFTLSRWAANVPWSTTVATPPTGVNRTLNFPLS